jgi:ATP-dependent RNA helicase DDX23/PRP28
LISKQRIDVSPLLDWQQSLPKTLVESLIQCGYDSPLPVQAECIALSLASYDVIGLSQPGTGKTLAYVIPVVTRILQFLSDHKFDPAEGPLGLILVPTHELADQVNNVIRQICDPLAISSFSLIGGFSITDQALKLESGFHIVVATPGRMNDVLESSLMVITQCFSIVLDEADKMVDKSFGPQIAKILSAAPKDRNFMMFSATMPVAVISLVEGFFVNVVRVRVGQVGDASENIKQVVIYLPKKDKKQAFLEHIHLMKTPVLVFVNSRESCDEVAWFLGYMGYKAAAIHGGKSQKERKNVVNAVLDGIISILVATDVMARGIDIEELPNVVNYEMPRDISVYVHRIGRTGRAGAAGVATSFVTPEDRIIMYDLTRLLQRNNFAVPEGMLKNPASQSRVEDDTEPEPIG